MARVDEHLCKSRFNLANTVPVVLLRNSAAGLLLKPVGPVIAGPGEKSCAMFLDSERVEHQH